ncbi:MAG: hypothetical protein QXR44_00845 [Thermoproteota archaeon]
MNIQEIGKLGLHFILFSVNPLPEDWTTIATEVKRERKVFIQFFKHGSLVTELVPFLVYNVHQAFKYRYNSLNGLEQELLLALFGKRSFQDALSTLGVSAYEKATVLLLSDVVKELNEAAVSLETEFSKRGSIIKPFENDRDLFTSFWSRFLETLGFKIMGAEYCRVLELVKERIATSYL